MMQTLSVHELQLGMRVIVDYAWECREDEGVTCSYDGFVHTITYDDGSGLALIQIENTWADCDQLVVYNGNPSESGFAVRRVEEL